MEASTIYAILFLWPLMILLWAGTIIVVCNIVHNNLFGKDK